MTRIRRWKAGDTSTIQALWGHMISKAAICAYFIAKIATHEPDDGAAADAFVKFMSDQCPGRIKTKP